MPTSGTQANAAQVTLKCFLLLATFLIFLFMFFLPFVISVWNEHQNTEKLYVLHHHTSGDCNFCIF